MAHVFWRINVIGPLPSLSELKFYDGTGTLIPATGGTAIDNGTPFAVPANAFDGNTATNWTTYQYTAGWIGYQFASAVDVHLVAISADTNGGAPGNFSLDYSDNGTTWTALLSWYGVYWGQVVSGSGPIIVPVPGLTL